MFPVWIYRHLIEPPDCSEDPVEEVTAWLQGAERDGERLRAMDVRGYSSHHKGRVITWDELATGYRQRLDEWQQR
jgi:hypothetical protein